jgi:hypothetical protein
MSGTPPVPHPINRMHEAAARDRSFALRPADVKRTVGQAA